MGYKLKKKITRKIIMSVRHIGPERKEMGDKGGRHEDGPARILKMMRLDFMKGWRRRTGLKAINLEMEGLPLLPWPGRRSTLPGKWGNSRSRGSMSNEDTTIK